MVNPLISIITVCLNREKTISRTIESVLNQKYSNFEYFIIDGNSNDNTVRIIKEYEIKFKNKKIPYAWISEKDNGIYDALNKGIEKSNGILIGHVNSDDYYEKDALINISKAYKNNKDYGVFYGFLRMLHNDNEIVINRYNYNYYLVKPETGVVSATQHTTCFVKKDVYNQIGKFDTNFKIAADHDFLIRAKIKGIKFYPLNKIISNFSSGGAAENMSDYERFEQRYRILYKNGLISKEKYIKYKNELKYKRYKNLKSLIIKKILKY